VYRCIHKLRSGRYPVPRLAYLARQFNKDVPMTGWPTDQVYSEFIEALNAQGGSVIIILDELDKLVRKSGDDVLYNLSRINLELTDTG